MEEFHRLRLARQILWHIECASGLVLLFMAIGVVISGIWDLFYEFSEFIEWGPGYFDHREFEQFGDPSTKTNETREEVIIGVSLILVAVSLVSSSIIMKRFENSVLREINLGCEWSPREISLEQDKVRREQERRADQQGELNRFLLQVFSLREYGMCDENHLRFLDEKFSVLLDQEPSQAAPQDDYDRVVEEAVSDAHAKEKAEERIKQYETEISGKYPPDVVKQKVEELRMRIFRDLHEDL